VSACRHAIPPLALIIHRVGWQLPGASRGDLRLLF
jgi:hypothetical protein